jgi:hypothetical protein
MGALFDKWKKGFDAWESRAAEVSAEVLSSPRVLEPSGVVLSVVMRGRARADRALEGLWSSVGLPTRRDQERTLHLLNVMERKILDLEEKLEDAHDELRRERQKR